MPGRVAGLSRATRCALLLRATQTMAEWRGDGKPGSGRACPRCAYCGKAVIPRAQVGESWYGLAAATMDHVDPAGPTDPSNLVVACWAHNCAKGKRHARDYDPAGWPRVQAELARPVDLAAGRAMARELYPRPTPRQSLTVADRESSACAESEARQ